MRRLLSLLTAVAALTAAGAPAHAAGPSVKKSIWGPIMVDGASAFPTYADLGAGLLQLTMNWNDVAPTRPANATDPNDPAYHWDPAWDLAVSEAKKYGMRLSFAVLRTPPWANGGADVRQAPTNTTDYADFMEAAARRYPSIHLWMVWIEPTKESNFQPLTPDNGRRLHGAGLRGPHIYAQLLDQTYGRLKALSRANKIIGGNTFTVGTVSPLRWIQALKLPNGRRPRMDLWGHNPFSARRPTAHGDPLGSGYADISDLHTLEGWLDRAFRHGPKPTRHLRLFLSEYSLPTDHANFEFNFFVTRATQANWLRRAVRVARSNSRVFTLGYLALYDDPIRPGGDQVERGLLTREGKRKPAYAAFRDG